MNYISKTLAVATLLAVATVGIGTSALAQTAGLSLACLPGAQSVGLGQTANFAVTGGNGTYTFSGAGVATTTTTNTVFSASFGTSDTHTVTVASGAETASCVVNVSSSSAQTAVLCNAPSSVTAGQAATFVATGGNGAYVWSATNATISDPNGPVLRLTYPAAGSQTVTVTSAGQSSACSVNVLTASVPSLPLACSPASQTVTVGQTATISASGGTTGIYTWYGAGLQLINPAGPAFNVTYNVPGSYSIALTSGAQTVNCGVNVTPAASVPGLPNTGFDPGI